MIGIGVRQAGAHRVARPLRDIGFGGFVQVNGLLLQAFWGKEINSKDTERYKQNVSTL
jgi:hypothetical protein